ncbi:pyruvate carboxylase subunit B, partial [Streptomyces tanashiensis]|uniref:pyruvate carboxylase subunit B n=1 Tax=Streptomyces tanashiensis TaxID=67367 RepID=UPI0033C0F9D5
EQRPQLLTARHSADRGTKLLTYLADVTVNKPHGPRPDLIAPATKLPRLPAGQPPAGSRQRLTALGPEGFARSLRESPTLGVTDTTFRDAHQSLLATRVRTKDLLAVAPTVAHTLPQLLSLECWGGATYDVALRFLAEDPWERLAALREAVPNICLQMLLRGRNTVGYTPYPTEVTDAFVQEAAVTGVDIFRIFDALNDVDQMRPAIDAVRETGTAVAEVALCYTADLSDPAEKLYTLDYYLRLAEKIVAAGAHVLAVKDMAGLLRAPAAAKLVSALRREFELPVHLHTHDTAGGQLATYLAAIQAGADAVDGAVASMAGTTSQPSLSAIVAATDHSERPTGLDLQAVGDLEPYWESVRKIYAPFEAGLDSPTGRVYHHEIPGGQLSNLRTQAVALGLGDRFEDVESTYAAADRMLGRLVKVTPSSKVVGDLALHLVGAGVAPEDFEAAPNRFDIPDSVIGFLHGELGTPPGGWPEPFRSKALEGRAGPKPMRELTAEDRTGLAKDRRATLNRLLFPGPTKAYETHRQAYGDTSVLDSKDFFYGLRPGKEYAVDFGPGVRLLIELEAIGEADERGMRTVLSTLNGQLRPIQVRDNAAAADLPVTEKADRSESGHVAAPFAGVVTLAVAEGDEVEAGATVATIEAMKMEASITATTSGRVSRLAITRIQQVEAGDLLVEIR